LVVTIEKVTMVLPEMRRTIDKILVAKRLPLVPTGGVRKLYEQAISCVLKFGGQLGSVIHPILSLAVGFQRKQVADPGQERSAGVVGSREPPVERSGQKGGRVWQSCLCNAGPE
jgi:hypothetical protein